MAVYSLKGANGQLYIYENHLEIHRKGVLAKLSHLKERHTSIPYNELSRVKMHPGVLLISGYFYFERRGRGNSCGLIAAACDEDCIVFRAYENEKAVEIHKYLQSKI